MNWTELLIAVVSHVSWPATIIILAWMFRDALRSIFGRIESADSKYLKMKFKSNGLLEILSRSEGIAETLGLPPAIRPKLKPVSELEDNVKQQSAMAQKKPAAALSDTWIAFEAALGDSIEKRSGKRPSSIDLLSEAAKFYDQRMFNLLTLLAKIVNEQKSQPAESVDTKFVLRFIELSSRVIIGIQTESANSDPNGKTAV